MRAERLRRETGLAQRAGRPIQGVLSGNGCRVRGVRITRPDSVQEIGAGLMNSFSCAIAATDILRDDAGQSRRSMLFVREPTRPAPANRSMRTR